MKLWTPRHRECLGCCSGETFLYDAGELIGMMNCKHRSLKDIHDRFRILCVCVYVHFMIDLFLAFVCLPSGLIKMLLKNSIYYVSACSRVVLKRRALDMHRRRLNDLCSFGIIYVI